MYTYHIYIYIYTNSTVIYSLRYFLRDICPTRLDKVWSFLPESL